MKRERTAITLVEILTVLAIISLLAGILIPAVTAVKTAAKEAKQKAQFLTIELGLTAFKNDDGDYPPSDGLPDSSDYCGAQKLAEALLGWDLLGFHPKSDFTSNGTNKAGVFVYNASDPLLFSQRKGPYLELATTNAFKLSSLFLKTGTGLLEADTFVICDVFGATKVMVGGKQVKAGAPVLYYKADPSGKKIGEIYNFFNNAELVSVKATDDGKNHLLDDPSGGRFYDYITDPKITARDWPYRPDSYILISAGADGLYGTGDDIRNFGY